MSVNNGFPVNAGYLPEINALAVKSDGAGGAYLLAGTTQGVFRSTDNGSSWSAASPRLSTVTALAVNGSNIFAATYRNGVHRSTDNGTTWFGVNQGLPRDYFNSSRCVVVTSLEART
jgi:ligand-binding sensor domain-containing protein